MPKSAAEAASAELDRVDRVVRQAVQNGSVEYVGDDLVSGPCIDTVAS